MLNMRESWTDERLDDLNAKVDRGFEQVDRRFEQVDRRFERLEANLEALRVDTKAGFESLHRLMVVAIVALTGSIVTGFAAIVGFLATQA
ncbi:MAG TPA: hypothetical protein VF731_12940 [Solirubrobacterales bacterium]